MAHNPRRSAAVKKKKIKKPRAKWLNWLLQGAIPLAIVLFLFLFVFPNYFPFFWGGSGQPDFSPKLSDTQAAALIESARSTLIGQNPIAFAKDIPPVYGAAVAVYGAAGPRLSAACFGEDAHASVVCAAKRLAPATKGFGQKETDKVSVHLLRDVKGLFPMGLREKGFGYGRGLYSVCLAGEGRARLITDTVMHVGGLSLSRAIDRLRKGKGTPVHGEVPRDGAFLAATESFTEYEGRPVRLYRASTLMEVPDSAEIRRLSTLAGDYLVKIMQPNNKWLYEGNLGYDKYRRSYNLLRHAGTIYSLYQLYQETLDPHYRQIGDRGWRWLLEQLDRETLPDGSVAAFPVEIKRSRKNTKYVVKLGGTGLALIALSEKMNFNRNEKDMELGRQLANHILRSQKPDGSFESYWPWKGTPAKKRRSIYYPGEAMLGLLRFYKHEPDPRYLEAARLSSHYFASKRFKILGMRLNVPPDAWLMLALDEMHRLDPHPAFADYCDTLVDSMINDQLNRDWEIWYPDYAGGYFPYPPVVTPAGSRMEGITACYHTLERSDRPTERVRENLRIAARFQLERMIRPEFAHLYPNPQRALGALRHSPVSNFIRIDYNQHNISGLLEAANILEK